MIMVDAPEVLAAYHEVQFLIQGPSKQRGRSPSCEDFEQWPRYSGTSSESTNMWSNLLKWTNQTMGPMWTIGLGIDPKLCLLLQKNLDFFHNRICIQTQNRVHIEETLRMNTIFISIKSKAELLWWWSLPYLCYLILPIRCQRQYLIWDLATLEAPENTTFEHNTDPSENCVQLMTGRHTMGFYQNGLVGGWVLPIGWGTKEYQY